MLLLLSLSCALKAPPVPPQDVVEVPPAMLEERTEASAGVTSPAAQQLLEDHWAWYLRTHPIHATQLGVHAYSDLLPDPSREARDASLLQRRAFLRKAQDLLAGSLSEADRTTMELFAEELAAGIAMHVCRTWEWSIDARFNLLTEANYLADLHELDTAEDGRNLVARIRALPGNIDIDAEHLRKGLAEGRVASEESLRRVVEQFDTQLAKPDAEWPVAAPATQELEWTDGDVEAFRADLTEAVAALRPALESFRDLVRDELIPESRSGNDIGLTGLPDGQSCYLAAIRKHTTLDRDADTIHQQGLDTMASIHDEMQALAPGLFDTDDLETVFERLRTDPALYFEDGDAIEAFANDALARAEAALPEVLGEIPTTPCVVRRIPDYQAPYTYVAYYRPPNPDGSKPGEYFVNTSAPTTRPRYEAAALAFHESVPGHHTQHAFAQELGDLPAFRRYGYWTVFAEGWALYTERLADEMGLYTSDLERLGMLSYQSWRAARLVVDTGIHSKGWSRTEAEAYMQANTPLAANNIANEVDRYITWPGQALGYMTGQLEIQRLRRQAEAARGEAFDLKAFHDDLLSGGSVSIGVLERRLSHHLTAPDAESP